MILLWLGSVLVNAVAALIKNQSFLATVVNGIEIPIGFSIGWFCRYLWLRGRQPESDGTEGKENTELGT